MKKYRLSSLLVTFVLALTLLAPFSALAADAPHITSRHAVLMDANYGEILYEKAAREKAYPASITKVMTALLVSEAIDRGELSQDQMITVSSTSQFDLSADGSTANLKPGEVISVKDLMYCLLLPSANEAANILAEAVCGDVASFIELMNQRARELGCTGTHFANTHGLHDDDHYTTAYDICLFTREALKHDLIREVVGTSVYTVPATNLSEPREFYNTNALLSNVPIIMLTAKGEDTDKIIGFECGADDYLTKPFNILELKARVRALLRRAGAAQQQRSGNELAAGHIILNTGERTASRDGVSVELTAKEFDLMELLMRNPGRVYSRENLLNVVWGYEYIGDFRTVDVHIRRLREKLELDPANPEYIRTKWGVGYYLSARGPRRLENV